MTFTELFEQKIPGCKVRYQATDFGACNIVFVTLGSDQVARSFGWVGRTHDDIGHSSEHGSLTVETATRFADDAAEYFATQRTPGNKSAYVYKG